MDEIPGTYEKMKLTTLIEYHESGHPAEELCRRVHRQFLYEHVDDLQVGEQLALMLFFTGHVNVWELEQHLLSCPLDDDHRVMILDTAAKVHAERHQPTTETVDIFMRNAMGFSVKQALSGLTSAAHNYDGPVGWGNTNLSPRDYKSALHAAHQSNRPVHFVRWGVELPVVPLEELYRRNIIRYLRTGRYVPLSVMVNYLQRSEAFFGRLEDRSDSSELANLAGFSMDASGRVKPHGKRF